MNAMQLSKKLPEQWTPSPYMQALSQLKEERIQCRLPIIDLTVSSPWNCDLQMDISPGLLNQSCLDWNSDPCGMLTTRQAIAALPAYQECQSQVYEFVLTSGTSEAYSHIFKILCDPGDTVVVPQPGYPLLEVLASLDHLKTEPYYYEQDSRGLWKIQWNLLEFISAQAKIFLVVNPTNPMGSVLTRPEWIKIGRFCKERNLALVVDEVFASYCFEPCRDIPWQELCEMIHVFRLDGLSKRIGMPQLKLAWIWHRGPYQNQVSEALEYIADAYLSVSSIPQSIAPALLQLEGEFQNKVMDRLKKNLQSIQSLFKETDYSPVQGGWYCCLKCHGLESESLALDLFKNHGILVQPAYFFDFNEDDWLVISLLQESKLFKKALHDIRRVAFVNALVYNGE